MSEGATTSFSAELSRALRAYVSTARARRLYGGHEHPFVAKKLDELFETLTDLLSREEEIAIRVHADALLHEGDRVLEDSEEGSIPFAFFRDGVRRIVLSSGLERWELAVLVAAAVQDPHRSGLGHDVASYLWQHELSHIRYVVVEVGTFGSGGDGDGFETDEEADIEALLARIYGGPGAEEGTIGMIRVDASDVPALAIADGLESIDDLAPGFHPVESFDEASYVHAIVEQANAESPEDIEFRLLGAALSALATTLESRDSEPLVGLITNAYDAALSRVELERAARIAAAVRSIDAPWVETWIKGAVDEARLRPLLTGTGGDRAAILEHLSVLLRLCGPLAVQPILACIPGVTDSALRRRLSDIALAIGIESLEPIRPLIVSEEGGVAQEGVYILSRIGSSNAHQMILEARSHNDPIVRLAVAGMVPGFTNEQALALGVSLLNDADDRVRVVAARVLSRSTDPRALGALKSVAESEELAEAPFEVKEAMLQAFALLGRSQALPQLVANIKRGEGTLLKRPVEELAVASVRALRMVGTPAAGKALRKATKAWNRKVRDAARALQAQIEREVGGGDGS